MLLDGFKFDLRLYVLVVSVDPLRVYLAREGMARLCSEPYKSPAADNLKDVFSHLTNYSLNKKNENYVFARAQGDNAKAADGNGGRSPSSGVGSFTSNSEPSSPAPRPGGGGGGGGGYPSGGYTIGSTRSMDSAPSGDDLGNVEGLDGTPGALAGSAATPSPVPAAAAVAAVEVVGDEMEALVLSEPVPEPVSEQRLFPMLPGRPVVKPYAKARGDAVGEAAVGSPVRRVTGGSSEEEEDEESEEEYDRSGDSAGQGFGTGLGTSMPLVGSPQPLEPVSPAMSALARLRAERCQAGQHPSPEALWRRPSDASEASAASAASDASLGASVAGASAASAGNPLGGGGGGSGSSGGGLERAVFRAAQVAQVGACGGLPLCYVNHFGEGEYKPFTGLFPAIAAKLVAGRPFRSIKECYDVLSPDEKPRLLRHDRRLCLGDPGDAPPVSAYTTASVSGSAGATGDPRRGGGKVVAVAATAVERLKRKGRLGGSLPQVASPTAAPAPTKQRAVAADDETPPPGEAAGAAGNGGEGPKPSSRSRAAASGAGAGAGAEVQSLQAPRVRKAPVPTTLACTKAQPKPSNSFSGSSAATGGPGSAAKFKRSESAPLSGAGGSELKAEAGKPETGAGKGKGKGEGKGDGKGEGDGKEEEEEPEDTGVEDGDGPPGSKRRLKDVLKQLKKERGLSETKFWERTVDLVAKTMISIQAPLAQTYRRSFPRKRRRAGAVASSEEEEEDDDEEDDEDDEDDPSAAMAAAARRRRREKSKAGTGGKRKGDPLRPKMLDAPPEPGEDGDDSFRCFQVLGIDVLLDDLGQPHLLEINANPSLNVMHEARGEDGVLRLEVSPVDEAIKLTVVRDMVRLTRPVGCPGAGGSGGGGGGGLPRDEDLEALGTWMPVVTRQTEGRHARLMVHERLRHMFVSCAGLKFDGVSIDPSAFQRVARKLKVKSALADLIFAKACADKATNRPGDAFETFLAAQAPSAGSASYFSAAAFSSRADALGLSAFPAALFDLCTTDGANSFAERYGVDPADRTAVLNAAISAYSADDDDDEAADY